MLKRSPPPESQQPSQPSSRPTQTLEQPAETPEQTPEQPTQTLEQPSQQAFENNLPPRPSEVISGESSMDEIPSAPSKTVNSSASSGDIFNAINDIAIQSNSISQILSKNLKGIDQSLKNLNLSEQQAEWNLRHINSKLDQLGSNLAVYQQAQLEILSIQTVEMKNLVHATLAQGKVLKDIWRVLMKSNGLQPVSERIDATSEEQ